ncbi:unnamed protein product, partial [Didymodactylos carnosus]
MASMSTVSLKKIGASSTLTDQKENLTPPTTAQIGSKKSASLNLNQFYEILNHCSKDNLDPVSKVCEIMDVSECEENINCIEALIHLHTVKTKTKMESWRKQNSKNRENMFSKIVLEIKDLTQRPKTPKRPARDFSEVGTRQKRRKLTDLNEQLDEFAESNGISVNQVIGYLLYQRNYNSNKKLADLGKELYESSDISSAKNELDLNATLALKTHLEISRNQLDFLKMFCSPYMNIPNREYIRQHSNTLLPVLDRWSTGPDRRETGIFIANREEVIILTIKRLIEMLQKQNITVPNKLQYREKSGHDGAGSMTMYRSVNSPMESANIFSKMFSPLSLKSDKDVVLWSNPSPNSSHYCRPLALIAEKESKELLRSVNERFEPPEKRLSEQGVDFEFNGTNYQVSIKTEASMKDLKIRTLESGLGGAECLLCSTRSEDWKNLGKLKKFDSFSIDRTAEKTLELYKQMVDAD